MFSTLTQLDLNTTRFTRTAFTALSCMLIALAQTSSVSAVGSANSPSNYQTSRDFYSPTPAWPLEVGCWLHHSSTALEGALRGRALMIQAAGNYLLNMTQAEIMHEHARALARENWLHAGDYYRQVDAWRAQRSAEKRVENEAAQPQKYVHAYGLNGDEFNRLTGEIAWPVALQSAEYDKVRTRIEQIFRVHAEYGSTPDNTSAEIVRRVDRLKATLRLKRQDIPRDDYLVAQKFLIGLKLEVEAIVM